MAFSHSVCPLVNHRFCQQHRRPGSAPGGTLGLARICSKTPGKKWMMAEDKEGCTASLPLFSQLCVHLEIFKIKLNNTVNQL